MRRYFHASLVAGLLLAAGTAQAIDEIEINHPVGNAQRIAMPSGSVAISAWLGNTTGTDTDYYVFYGTADDVLTFDIDGGCDGSRSVDTIMAVFDADNGYSILRQMDDPTSGDAGSSAKCVAVSGMLFDGDSRLDNVKLPASGYYVVGVSGAPRSFIPGGDTRHKDSTTNLNGDYKLVISGATPQVQQINIEVKPGNDGLAPINPRSNGKIPVALLSSNGFDAMNVKTESLSFGATGDEGSLSHCARNGEDVNGDGRLDLVCHFENQKAGFAKGDLEGILRGKMKWGSSFEGRGFLKVVPEKRGS